MSVFNKVSSGLSLPSYPITTRPLNLEEIIKKNITIIIEQIGVFSEDSKRLIEACIVKIENQSPTGTNRTLIDRLRTISTKNNLITNEPDASKVSFAIRELKEELMKIVV